MGSSQSSQRTASSKKSNGNAGKLQSGAIYAAVSKPGKHSSSVGSRGSDYGAQSTGRGEATARHGFAAARAGKKNAALTLHSSADMRGSYAASRGNAAAAVSNSRQQAAVFAYSDRSYAQAYMNGGKMESYVKGKGKVGIKDGKIWASDGSSLAEAKLKHKGGSSQKRIKGK